MFDFLAVYRNFLIDVALYDFSVAYFCEVMLVIRIPAVFILIRMRKFSFFFFLLYTKEKALHRGKFIWQGLFFFVDITLEIFELFCVSTISDKSVSC